MRMILTAVIGLLGGSFGAALVALVQFFVNRHDERKGKSDTIRGEIAAVRQSVDKLSAEVAMDRATSARIRILDFSDEVRHGVKHSKESFDQVNLDIDAYRRYCDGHKDYRNNRAVMAIANIERVYRECLKQQDFLD